MGMLEIMILSNYLGLSNCQDGQGSNGGVQKPRPMMKYVLPLTFRFFLFILGRIEISGNFEVSSTYGNARFKSP